MILEDKRAQFKKKMYIFMNVII